MDTADLYRKMKEENIYYIHHELRFTRAMIGKYKNIITIVVDDKQIQSEISENTVIIQELGHYMANLYYKTNSSFEYIEEVELLADIAAWKEFFPYPVVRKLVVEDKKTASEIAEYFKVETIYIAKCLNYYYEKSNGFESLDITYEK